MSKTVEDLLKPRYIVIHDWPGVAGKVMPGQILTPDEEDDETFWIDGEPFLEDKLKDYPYLFNKLEWWQYRQPDEMPEYVRCIRTPDQQIMPGQVMKMKWDNVLGRDENDRAVIVDTNCYLPATKEEYEQYISSSVKTIK